MTTGPKLKLGKTLVPGLLAVALFALMALVVLNTPFDSMADGGFEAESITAAIGYSLFNFDALQQSDGVPGTEPFLAAFLLIAVALDAALDASLVLAKREEDGEPVSALGSIGPSDAAPGTGSGDSSGFSHSGPAATDGGTGDTNGTTDDVATDDGDDGVAAGPDADADDDDVSSGGEDR
ncbi:hypothetical protein SAMN04487967_0463 [Natronorubrum sediminis]|uniref:Uncharacterized protein n=1 Tax=Natronorubrum sediminis TaxID=640943 RepID=A0A1H6FNA6_9EURY|nr:hypothetical protein [Natronorubrum sediminis]SEH11680.1 hypothetical protein SAMN04487967_0463 [Natronorubrum sediminis]